MKKTKFKERNKYKTGEIIIIVMTVAFLIPLIEVDIFKNIFKDFPTGFLVV